MIIASGLSGTIGRHLKSFGVIPLNQRLDEITSQANLKDGDYYFHLGGIVGPGRVKDHPELSKVVNVGSVEKLGILCRERNVERFVYVSTSHVYSPATTRITEENQIQPANLYAEQKFQAEEILRDIYSDNPQGLIIIRVFSILGWDTKPFTLGGAIKKLVDDPSFHIENGDDVRDFLTPKQAGEAIYEIGTTKHTYQTINLCTGKGISIKEAAMGMLSLEVNSPDLARVRNGCSESPRIVGDPSLLDTVLNKRLKWEYSK